MHYLGLKPWRSIPWFSFQSEKMLSFTTSSTIFSPNIPQFGARRLCCVNSKPTLAFAERNSPAFARTRACAKVENTEYYDVVIVGSGFGGLSCAAITCALGFKTIVLESHYAPGGVAHGFEVQNEAGTFHFDTGPSFFCGLSTPRSLNPVKMCLDAVGETVQCVPYDHFCIDDLKEQTTLEVSSDEAKTLSSLEKITPSGVVELRRFNNAMRAIHAGMTVPSIALRSDWRIFPVILRRWATSMLKLLPHVSDVKKPVSVIVDRCGVKDPYVRRILDLEAFLLSGLKASGTITGMLLSKICT